MVSIKRKKPIPESPATRVPLLRQPVSDVLWVPREDLLPNDYNPNHVPPRELALLRHSILVDGWTQPIVCLDDGRTIVDGFHRWSVSGDPAIAALTGGLVPIVCIDADRTKRIAATVRHNRARGHHGIAPMSQIVHELRDAGLSDGEIQRELGMEEEEVIRLGDQSKMPERVARAVGGFSESWQPENYRKDPPPAPQPTSDGRRLEAEE